MEEKKKLWEKKWFALVVVFVCAPVLIFSLLKLVVAEPKLAPDDASKIVIKKEVKKDTGLRVSSFVADTRKAENDASKANASTDPEPTPEPTPEPIPEPTPEPSNVPVEGVKGSSADKRIASEIDEYVNVFLKDAQSEGLAIQQEQVALMAGGALTKENARKVKTHLVPRMIRLSEVFSKKKVKGDELRALHEVAVAGEKSKYASVLKYIKAYETNDGALANEANAEIYQLTDAYNSYGLSVIELANKYGVTIR